MQFNASQILPFVDEPARRKLTRFVTHLVDDNKLDAKHNDFHTWNWSDWKRITEDHFPALRSKDDDKKAMTGIQKLQALIKKIPQDIKHMNWGEFGVTSTHTFNLIDEYEDAIDKETLKDTIKSQGGESKVVAEVIIEVGKSAKFDDKLNQFYRRLKKNDAVTKVDTFALFFDEIQGWYMEYVKSRKIINECDGYKANAAPETGSKKRVLYTTLYDRLISKYYLLKDKNALKDKEKLDKPISSRTRNSSSSGSSSSSSSSSGDSSSNSSSSSSSSSKTSALITGIQELTDTNDLELIIEAATQQLQMRKDSLQGDSIDLEIGLTPAITTPAQPSKSLIIEEGAGSSNKRGRGKLPDTIEDKDKKLKMLQKRQQRAALKAPQTQAEANFQSDRAEAGHLVSDHVQAAVEEAAVLRSTINYQQAKSDTSTADNNANVKHQCETCGGMHRSDKKGDMVKCWTITQDHPQRNKDPNLKWKDSTQGKIACMLSEKDDS